MLATAMKALGTAGFALLGVLAARRHHRLPWEMAFLATVSALLGLLLCLVVGRTGLNGIAFVLASSFVFGAAGEVEIRRQRGNPWR